MATSEPTTATFIGPPTREEERVMRIYYIIYSADVTADARDWLDDELVPGDASLWTLTEGDEQYEFDYLGEGITAACFRCDGDGFHEEMLGSFDSIDEVPRSLGVTTNGRSRSREGVYAYHLVPCDVCKGTGEGASRYKNGGHRKWVGELTHEEFLELCERRCIDLDEDERPIRYEDTMGSITEYGHLPAYAIDDTEGWGYSGEVIMSQFYVSEGLVPMGGSEGLRARCPTCDGFKLMNVGEEGAPNYVPCPVCGATGGLHPYTLERMEDECTSTTT